MNTDANGRFQSQVYNGLALSRRKGSIEISFPGVKTRHNKIFRGEISSAYILERDLERIVLRLIKYDFFFFTKHYMGQ